MGDIVSEARSMKPSTTWNRARVNEMADEIERAEAVIEAADELYTRFLVLHTTGQIEIPAELHKYAENLGAALEAHDKERSDEE